MQVHHPCARVALHAGPVVRVGVRRSLSQDGVRDGAGVQAAAQRGGVHELAGGSVEEHAAGAQSGQGVSVKHMAGGESDGEVEGHDGGDREQLLERHLRSTRDGSGPHGARSRAPRAHLLQAERCRAAGVQVAVVDDHRHAAGRGGR